MSTLIFDFDGTLGDSFELVLDIAYGLTGLAPLNQDEIVRLRHLPVMKAVREVGIPLRHVPRLLLRGKQLMQARMHEVHPFDGIPEALRALHEQGHRLLIVSSNSETNVRAFLQAHNLELYFDSVHGGAGLFNKASALKRIMRHDGIQAADCYYIGDEVRDIAAAAKIKVRSVAVIWGYQAEKALTDHNPFALARTPAELVGVFGPGKV